MEILKDNPYAVFSSVVENPDLKLKVVDMYWGGLFSFLCLIYPAIFSLTNHLSVDDDKRPQFNLLTEVFAGSISEVNSFVLGMSVFGLVTVVILVTLIFLHYRRRLYPGFKACFGQLGTSIFISFLTAYFAQIEVAWVPSIAILFVCFSALLVLLHDRFLRP